MSFGFIDPDSVRKSDDNIICDFYSAATGKKKGLRVSAARASELDHLLEGQSKLGILYFDTSVPGYNSANSFSGIVVPDNETSGVATLASGEKIEAMFPEKSFSNDVPHRFKATGRYEGDHLDVFMAEMIPAPELAADLGP